MKSNWQIVYEDNFEYMRKLITVVCNRYRGIVEENGAVSDGFSNNKGSILLMNLWEEHELTPIMVQAFKKAHETWDGIREFRPLYRQIFLNLVSNEEKRLKKSRIMETHMSFFEDEEGNGIDAVDTRVWENPASLADFKDFVETLPEKQKLLVQALLNSEQAFGTKENPTIKDLLGNAYEYARDILGMSHRSYYETMQDIRERLEERSQTNVPNKVCGFGFRKSTC